MSEDLEDKKRALIEHWDLLDEKELFEKAVNFSYDSLKVLWMAKSLAAGDKDGWGGGSE